MEETIPEDVRAAIERTRPDDIPPDVWASAAVGVELHEKRQLLIARAIMAERKRWDPAVTYFERYCQDEADDVENCVCGQQQHEDAKAFAAVATSIRSGV